MKHILNVENDPINAYLTERMLQGQYSVTTAGNAEEMWAYLAQGNFGLILMDIHLGDNMADGVELFQELQQHHSYYHLPVVAVTAYAMPGDQEKYLALGFTSYLAKPFRQEELTHLVSALALI